MKEKKLKGRIWVIKDDKGKFINNIDTDQIFHNKHLAITDVNEMAKHAFGNLKGFEDFPKKAKRGDIIIVGENFGSGSSRQQAVDCFSAIGISAIVAKSFGAIYKRNAINSALPIVECSEIEKMSVNQGESIEIDFETGEIRSDEKTIARAKPMNSVQMDIYLAGGLFNYAKRVMSDG